MELAEELVEELVGEQGTAGAEAQGDARRVVRDGLRRVVARNGLPPHDAVGARAWQNRLLDETGSDRRGLVQLLLRVHADGVLAPGVLVELPPGPLAAAAWAPVRARLAFGYASATYLDAEMARWAVDAWAYALGVIDATSVWRPPVLPSPTHGPLTLAGFPVGPVPVGPVPVASPPSAQAVVAGPGRHGGKTPSRVRRAAARAHGPPVHNPFPANFDRMAGSVFVGLFVLSAGAMWMGIATRREAGGLELRSGGMARSAMLEARPLGPVNARVEAGRDETAGPAATAAGEDTVRLRDGTVRTGRITRITRDAVLLYDFWADAVASVNLDDVADVRTRGGVVLPVGEAGPASAAPRALAGVATEGVGGRYTLRQRLLTVDGSESCDVVAEAVRRAAARPTVEVVTHTAGARTFTLASRPGVRGTVDADGRFRTEPVRGVRDGVHYWFRMAGQFNAGGFRAEAESATDAVLKYGSVQRCRVTAALDARRLP